MNHTQNAAYAEDKKLKIIEQIRKIASYLFVGAIVAFALSIVFLFVNEQFYWTDTDTIGIFLVSSIAMIAVGALIKFIMGKLAKRVAVNYTPEALKKVLDRVDEYAHKKGIDDSYIYSSSGVLPSFDRISDKRDYVKGVLRGIPVEFSEFTLQQEEEERDEDGNIKTTYSTVYSGVMLIAKHGLELKQDIMISQIVGNLFGGLKTESIVFNKQFDIHAGDSHDIFYFLTPHYMEKLLELSNDKGKIFAMTLLKDGKLLLSLKGKNYFEAKGVSDVNRLIQKIVDEMNELGDILERLEVPAEGSPYPMGKGIAEMQR